MKGAQLTRIIRRHRDTPPPAIVCAAREAARAGRFAVLTIPNRPKRSK